MTDERKSIPVADDKLEDLAAGQGEVIRYGNFSIPATKKELTEEERRVRNEKLLEAGAEIVKWGISPLGALSSKFGND